MKKKIKVEIGYFEFVFDDVAEAVAFAEIAKKTSTEDKSVYVSISFEGEDDEE
jgi:hypothetical protein